MSELTPFQKAGYTEDTIFKVIEEGHSLTGKLVKLSLDDGSDYPFFKSVDGHTTLQFCYYFRDNLEVYTESNLKEEYQYKVGDKVRILEEQSCHGIPVGTEVTLIKTDGDGSFKTDYGTWVSSTEIELIASCVKNTGVLVSNECSGSLTAEISCNEASSEFTVEKVYKVYHKDSLILKGSEEYLLKVKRTIEEALNG